MGQPRSCFAHSFPFTVNLDCLLHDAHAPFLQLPATLTRRPHDGVVSFDYVCTLRVCRILIRWDGIVELVERTQGALDEAWNVIPQPFQYPEQRMRRLLDVMGLAVTTAVQQKLVRLPPLVSSTIACPGLSLLCFFAFA